jgi:hypothetical protein
MITQKLLKEYFYYLNGSLYWSFNKHYKAKKDQKAGCLAKNHRYRIIKIDGRPFAEHRAIFLYHNGYLPEFVDHIDGNTCNNKIENLRETTCSQNQYNSKTRKDSSTNIKNVRWHKASKKWIVSIKIDKKDKYFGIYEDIELAELVAHEARDKYHQNFARHK